MNLQQRLQDELIGTTTDATVLVRDEDRQAAYGMNRVREVQRKIVPELAATIASDLKGMLPIPPFVSFEACRTATDYEERQALRKLAKSYHAAVDRYCSLTKEGE